MARPSTVKAFDEFDILFQSPFRHAHPDSCDRRVGGPSRSRQKCGAALHAPGRPCCLSDL